jgi:hypothetical protein
MKAGGPFRVHKRAPLDPILSQLNRSHLTSSRSVLILLPLLRPSLPTVSVLHMSHSKSCMHFSCLPKPKHIPPVISSDWSSYTHLVRSTPYKTSHYAVFSVFLSATLSWDQLLPHGLRIVGVVTRLRDWRSEVRLPAPDAIFSCSKVRTGSEAHPVSYRTSTAGFSPRATRPGCGTDHSPLYTIEDKKCGDIPPLPPYTFMACTGTSPFISFWSVFSL